MNNPVSSGSISPARAAVWTTPLLLAVLTVAGAVLTVKGLLATLPFAGWWPALTGETTDVQSLIFSHAGLARVVMSWLVGASLALSGVLFQQALRNPLAEAATLGVSPGAYLALVAATLFAPALLDIGQEWVALAGGAGAVVLVLGLARCAGFSATSVILCGLTVSLLCGAGAAALVLMNHEYLSTLFIWQTGSLVQAGWHPAFLTFLCLAGGAVVAGVLFRPMRMLTLEDAQVRALGASVEAVRWFGVVVAVALSAFTVSVVGVIGFVGLAAPHAMRLLGARTFAQQLIAAPIAGALLLWLTDQCVQQVHIFSQELSAGSASALMGAPFLLWLLATRTREEPIADRSSIDASPPRRRWLMPALLLSALGAVAVGLLVGRGADGWQVLSDPAAIDLLSLRLPRVGGALAAGVMLAIAGSVLQRLTGNPLASPELLGVSSGAGLGIVILLLAVPAFDRTAMTFAGLIGAFLALSALLTFSRMSATSGNRILLTGIALTTVFSAFASVLLTAGGPRVALLLTWMAGSTYRVTTTDAAVAGATALLALLAVLVMGRWLQILSLDTAMSRGLGLAPAIRNLIVLGFVSFLTAASTLVIGPISFVGLIAPHMATSLGFRRPVEHAVGSAALGAALLTFADWIGRNILFPWQLPAGLIATLVGGPVFLLLFARRR